MRGAGGSPLGTGSAGSSAQHCTEADGLFPTAPCQLCAEPARGGPPTVVSPPHLLPGPGGPAARRKEPALLPAHPDGWHFRGGESRRRAGPAAPADLRPPPPPPKPRRWARARLRSRPLLRSPAWRRGEGKSPRRGRAFRAPTTEANPLMGAEGSGLAPEVWGARGQHPRPSSQGRVPAPPGSTYSRISCLLRNVSSCGESAGQPWGRGTPRSRPVPPFPVPPHLVLAQRLPR